MDDTEEITCLLCDKIEEKMRRGLCNAHYMKFSRRRQKMAAKGTAEEWEKQLIAEGKILPLDKDQDPVFNVDLPPSKRKPEDPADRKDKIEALQMENKLLWNLVKASEMDASPESFEETKERIKAEAAKLAAQMKLAEEAKTSKPAKKRATKRKQA